MTKPILIADDDLADITAIERALEKAQVINPVYSVRDGAEVIAYLEGEGMYADRAAYPYPVLLFLDIKMPKLTGLEVLDWIRSHARHQELGIIILTAMENMRDVRQAYQLGAHSFLIKPVSVEELLTLGNVKGIRLQSQGDGNCVDFDTTCFPKSSSEIQPLS